MSVGVVLGIAMALLVPRLPAGDDLYIHLAWAQQSMRCLSEGALPVWLPDLNAGFGSPGIRLYSPLGPVTEAVLGLGLGSAERGLRAAACLAVLALFAVAVTRLGARGGLEAAVIVIAPMTMHSLLVRAAWSEFLAIPLMWWLLDRTLRRDVRPLREGAAFAALWLVHAPTTVMTVALAGLATLLRRDRRLALTLAESGAVGAGLTAWHWLPLLSEASLVDTSTVFAGLFRVDRNLLGSPSAHGLAGSIWLGWVAVALLGAVLAGRWWRSDPVRTALIVTCVALASRMTLPLWLLPTPLRLLQFPWRWLLPAAVLAAGAVAADTVRRRAAVALLVLISPLAVMVVPEVVRDPGLRARTTWQDAGRRLHDAIGGSAFFVDVPEHRPAAFAALGANVERFAGEPLLLDFPGRWSVTRWRPLDREIAIESARGGLVRLRLLAYPFWRVDVDGAPVSARLSGGVVAAAVPPGRHAVRVSWVGDPWARVGQAVAVVTLATMALIALRRRTGSTGGPTGRDGR